jgi:hypothetical protein
MKSKYVILIGIALMTEGFLANIYSSLILFPPTNPPMMKPLEGMDYVLVLYKQVFLISGIIGIIVTIAGIILWKKRK